MIRARVCVAEPFDGSDCKYANGYENWQKHHPWPVFNSIVQGTDVKGRITVGVEHSVQMFTGQLPHFQSFRAKLRYGRQYCRSVLFVLHSYFHVRMFSKAPSTFFWTEGEPVPGSIVSPARLNLRWIRQFPVALRHRAGSPLWCCLGEHKRSPLFRLIRPPLHLFRCQPPQLFCFSVNFVVGPPYPMLASQGNLASSQTDKNNLGDNG